MTPGRRAWLAAGLALALTRPAAAAALTVKDAKDVRAVVEAQLRAMAAGDAERAFSYAAPAIRAQFGDAQRFMAMVAGSYPMVIRPAATVFFQPTLDADGDVLQAVQLRDAAGKLWRAAYLLARQAGGTWRIAGCAVSADTPGSAT